MGAHSKASQRLSARKVPEMRQRTDRVREDKQLCQVYSVRRTSGAANRWQSNDQGRSLADAKLVVILV